MSFKGRDFSASCRTREWVLGHSGEHLGYFRIVSALMSSTLKPY
jgi:hypothetical protein